MDVLTAIFGEGRDLDSLQTAMRAVAVFFAALILIRISGRRAFGQRSPFDYVVAILLGATLSGDSRGVAGHPDLCRVVGHCAHTSSARMDLRPVAVGGITRGWSRKRSL